MRGIESTSDRHVSSQDAPMDLLNEVYRHFGLDLSEMKARGEEHDWGICRKEDAKRITGNMAGFGMGQSQRLIIDHDKEYDWVLVRRIERCGTVDGRPA